MKAREYHGEASSHQISPECKAFYNAYRRCNDPNIKNFQHYGGRGIQFRYESFEQFLQDVGRKPTPQHQLDRINNDGNYEPLNCKWSTPQEQALNRRSNVYLTRQDRTMTIQEWAIELNMSPLLIRQRYVRDGQCAECSLSNNLRWKRCNHKSL